ncbi:MAG: hypothetical protein AAFW68_05865, partial [Pseudomonadota bacterium]
MKINRRTALIGGGAALSSGMFSASACAATNEATGAWTPLADMPFPVQEIYPAPFRKSSDPGPDLKPNPLDLLVNAGGLTPDAEFNVTDQVTFYDPA